MLSSVSLSNCYVLIDSISNVQPFVRFKLVITYPAAMFDRIPAIRLDAAKTS
jgi:hypothetical protein